MSNLEAREYACPEAGLTARSLETDDGTARALPEPDRQGRRRSPM